MQQETELNKCSTCYNKFEFLDLNNAEEQFLLDKGYYTEKLIYQGRSSIWKGKNTSNDSDVIIKISDFNNQDEKLIINEININQILFKKLVDDEDKKHFVKLLDYFKFEAKNKYFLIFEYVDKKTVFELIKKKEESGLPLIIIYSLFYQILKALNFLHTNEICHMDLKNENFLISKEGYVKVIDFDVAVECNRDMKHSTNEICLEVFMNMTKEYFNFYKSKRNDLGNILLNFDSLDYDCFCLGLILYEMICSKMPVNTNSPNDNIDNYNALNALNKIPSNVYFVLNICLERNKSQKFNVNDILNSEWFKTSKIFLDSNSIKVEEVLKEYLDRYTIEVGLDLMDADIIINKYFNLDSSFDLAEGRSNTNDNQIVNKTTQLNINIENLNNEYLKLLN